MNKVRWGILGYARIARLSAIPAIARAGNAQLVAIASRSADKLAECAAQFPLSRLHLSYDALLADPDVDAIYVPLPNSMHHEWAIAALRAGKHVLCEKPIALTARQARDMAVAAKDAERLLMEGFMYRYTERIQRVREVLASGVLGSIRHVNAGFRFFLDRENTIKEQSGLGGGALYDVGCYPVNLLGLVTSKLPVRCQAVAEMKSGVDVNLSALLQYGDGMIANIHCGFNAHPAMHAEIIGTLGRLEVRDTFVDAAGEIVLYTKDGAQHIAIGESDRYGAEFRDFSAAILEGRAPLLSVDESIRNMEVLDMIRESLN